MLPVQSINTIIEWERRLEVEDQKRKEHRSEMHATYPTPPRSSSIEHQPFLGEVIMTKAENSNGYQNSRQEVCC